MPLHVHPYPAFILLFLLSISRLDAQIDPETHTFQGRNVEVSSSDEGVPIVRADSFEGIWYGAGRIMARDRLWDLELLRRDARGEFAEIGLWRIASELTPDEAIEHDRHRRTLNYSAEEQAMLLRRIHPDVVAMLGAFSEGVNDSAEVMIASGSLPAPYRQLRLDFQPWVPADSMLISDLIMHRAGGGGREITASPSPP